MSAPAAFAASTFLPEVNTATRTVLPVPFGITVEPRTCWSDLLASMPRFTAASTRLVELRRGELLDELQRFIDRILLAGRRASTFQAFMRFATAVMSQALHVDAHAARAARDGAHGGFEIGGREIRLLGLRDLLELLARDLADLVGVRRAAALLDADGLADQHRRRRRLHDEGEAAVASTP